MDHLLPSVHLESFLEWTSTSFEQSVAEFYAILVEEHLQVALAGGNLFLTLVSKTNQSYSVMFKSGDFSGQGRCLTEQFQLCECWHCHVINCIVVWK
jgi:hypothetical protein